MKKTVISFLFFISFFGYSQSILNESEIKTTDEEYEFLTEKYDLGNNSVMLQGNELKPFVKFGHKTYNCEYNFLVESSTKNVKAVLITVSKKKENGDKVKNLCLPINNEELFKKFRNKMDNLGLTIGSLFQYTGGSIISSHVESHYNFNLQRIKTTEEEYKFLTKTFASGDNIELLKGYELKPYFEDTIEEKYIFDYKLLVESKTQSVKAISIKITKLKKKDNKTEYLCMPLNNKELGLKFDKAAHNSGINMSYYLDVSFFSLISKIVDDRYNAIKS